MSRDFNEIMGDMSPEEMAQREYRLMLDVRRLGRMKLIKAIKESVEANDMDAVAELFPNVITVLALFLRDKVTMKVQMKRAIRSMIRVEYANKLLRMRLREKMNLLEEYDKDFAELNRENEELRFPDNNLLDEEE